MSAPGTKYIIDISFAAQHKEETIALNLCVSMGYDVCFIYSI